MRYTPISCRKLFHDIRSRSLFIPRAGDHLFLTEQHKQIEGQLADFYSETAREYAIPDGLSVQWTHLGDAVSTFLSETSNALWAQLYGLHVVDRLGEMLFGRNLRLELVRSKHHRRRFMVVGGRGSARPVVGDHLRRLISECLVRRLGFGSGRSESLSVRLSAQADTSRNTLFGDPHRRLSDDARPGVLNGDQYGAVFIDNLLGLDETAQHLVIDLLEASEGASDRRLLDAHLVVGARPGQTHGQYSTPSQTLFQLSCRDGLLELPTLAALVQNRAEWTRVFALLYREVALSQCGRPSRTLHLFNDSQGEAIIESDNAAHKLEQDAFLKWITEPDRINAIQDTLYPIFSDHAWPGDLWELEALIRRVIDVQDSPDLALEKLRDQAVAFRRRQPVIDPDTARQTEWLGRFEEQLEQLPLAEATLPQVLSKIESKYLSEAAKSAAASRAPKAARIQDVARMLGIPRQTASRKWQSYNLPAKLLTED